MQKETDPILQKVLNNEELTSNELRELCWDYDDIIIEKEELYSGRWMRGMKNYYNIENRYFALDWEEGLTEYQENEYQNQPYEVLLEEKEKTIIEKLWTKKN